MAKPKRKKRRKLAKGYIWFFKGDQGEYNSLCLFKGRNATGDRVPIKMGPLGAWQKVSVYAEWEE